MDIILLVHYYNFKHTLNKYHQRELEKGMYQIFDTLEKKRKRKQKKNHFPPF